MEKCKDFKSTGLLRRERERKGERERGRETGQKRSVGLELSRHAVCSDWPRMVLLRNHLWATIPGMT